MAKIALRKLAIKNASVLVDSIFHYVCFRIGKRVNLRSAETVGGKEAATARLNCIFGSAATGPPNSTPSNLVGLSASPIAPDAFTYPIRDVILRANGTIS